MNDAQNVAKLFHIIARISGYLQLLNLSNTRQKNKHGTILENLSFFNYDHMNKQRLAKGNLAQVLG